MRRFSFWLSSILLLGALFHCGGGPPPSPSPAGLPRIVSLSPSITEILVALGAGSQVVGICAPSDSAVRAPVVASLGTVNVERIVALRPTFCATVRAMQDPQSLSDLKRHGLEVVEYPVENLEQLWSCMEDLGRHSGKTAEGIALAKACRERVEAVKIRTRGRGTAAVLLVGAEPLEVAGEGTFLSEMMSCAGFSNAAAPLRGYSEMDLETMARRRPDALIFPQGDVSEASVRAAAETLERVLKKRPAEIPIPADILVRPGPGTPRAVELLAAARDALDKVRLDEKSRGTP